MGAMLSDLATCMRDHKLGDAQRAWEVIRPLLSLLLWLLPEHISTAASAPVKGASTAASQKSTPKGSNADNVTADGLSYAVTYTKAVAPVSV
jgi:hypothetical protein